MKNFRFDLNHIGTATILQTRKVAASAGLVWAVTSAGVRPAHWRRTVQEAWANHVVEFGVNALGITCFLALAVGVLICVQYQVLVGQFNESQILPGVFVVVVVRELGPLLVNLVLIARSGNAIATGLALKQVSGEVRVIEGQGIDPFIYLVLPRVFAMVFSAVCLTVLFIAVALLGVFLCGEWIDTKTGSLFEFADHVLATLTPADVVNLVCKAVVPSLIGSCICCLEGLEAGDTVTGVPTAASRAVQRSIVVLFATSAFISVVTYLR